MEEVFSDDVDLLALTIESFAYHDERLNNLDNTLVSERRTKDAKPQYICEKVKCHRMLYTLLVLIRESRTFRKIGLDRVGTYDVECMFGIIRLLCQPKHSWKRIRNSFANLLLVADLCLIIGYPIIPRSRLNDGGVKLYDCTDEKSSQSQSFFKLSSYVYYARRR